VGDAALVEPADLAQLTRDAAMCQRVTRVLAARDADTHVVFRHGDEKSRSRVRRRAFDHHVKRQWRAGGPLQSHRRFPAARRGGDGRTRRARVATDERRLAVDDDLRG
jgi:hypothetical protein